MTDALQSSRLLIVLSGPSGAGKTVLTRQLRSVATDLYFCVTATTRDPRPGERDGIDYHFLSRDEFTRRIGVNGFLEWARVPPPDGPYYGTPIAEVERAFRNEQDAFLQVDVQGAASVRSLVPSAVTIFLRPASVDALRGRVQLRGTEGEAEMERRLENARLELDREVEFDYAVVNQNGRLDEAVARVCDIIVRERAARLIDDAPTRQRS